MTSSDDNEKRGALAIEKPVLSSDGTEELEQLRAKLQAKEWDLEIQCQAMQEALVELEESRNRYADLYDFAPTGYVTFDEKGCIKEINLAGAALLGIERSRLLGMPMTVFLDKGSYKLFFDHLHSCRLTGKKVITELEIISKSNAIIYAQIISVPLTGVGGYGSNYRSVISDITERKFMEKEMSRIERLNLIGEMAAGIAHEIRNPLTTVRGFLQFFLRKAEFSQFDSRLNLMITELDRANSIITEYLSLARNKLLDQSLQNLNTIVQKLLPLLESDALLNEKWIVTKLSVDIPDLLLDAQEMRQLILNFVRNGLEAMLPGGQLTIGTFAEAEQVVLYIQDQGIGIPQEIEQKLGTPFVTTKENGTGLGLPICFSIANRHNAKIEVKTGDSGTTFMVKFPRNQP
ncbi:nitrogen regulation protein NR(II) [Sporomusa sp. KB1]|uniref:two-component system sensor histidine kinase NtrB n=1 Tax=Sporomusa sp. KB1 TaxID=943346 RepID=UPI0011AB92B7|nr:ATP-binding protein [Sporomusa sp. KB1]TWH46065.1 PAS domain S-box-containing protein [Sporomusa sp. KB1]